MGEGWCSPFLWCCGSLQRFGCSAPSAWAYSWRVRHKAPISRRAPPFRQLQFSRRAPSHGGIPPPPPGREPPIQHDHILRQGQFGHHIRCLASQLGLRLAASQCTRSKADRRCSTRRIRAERKAAVTIPSARGQLRRRRKQLLLPRRMAVRAPQRSSRTNFTSRIAGRIKRPVGSPIQRYGSSHAPGP
jgi:hypothetical protein